MRRVLLIALLLGALASAADKGGTLRLRVQDRTGALLDGHGVFKKDVLELETASGKKKLAWSQVESIEEIDPDAPPPDFERSRDRASFEDRRQALAKKTDEPRALGHQWATLGEWARRRGLPDEAKRAFEKALEVYPDESDAARALGRAKDDDGSWQDARTLFTKKLPQATTDAARYELARWAIKNGLDEEALVALDPINKKNPFDKQLLPFLRPITDRHHQASSLGFPLRGRWRASQDPAHHHEIKTYAVYAIDFYGEKDGRPWQGDGKKLEDHYAWSQPVHAVADGQVCGVQDGYPDNPVGKIPPGDLQMLNNSVSIIHSANEVSWYIHLQKGSIKVKIGDRVKRGDVIGLIGNSGASSQPHLHFTMVNAHRLSIPWKCEGWTLLADDGSRVKVKRARVLEGELIEAE